MTEAKLLSESEVAEIAEMFPNAEYQPDAETMPLCSFCDGAVDDHKANCVVLHVHALCQTVRALWDDVERLSKDNVELTRKLENSGRNASLMSQQINAARERSPEYDHRDRS